MRKFCWAYRNRFTDDLALVMRPHRKSVGGKYRIISGLFRISRGFQHDTEMLGTSVRSLTSQELRIMYEYVGRI